MRAVLELQVDDKGRPLSKSVIDMQLGRLLQQHARLFQPLVRLRTEMIFEFPQRALLGSTKQHVELPTSRPRLSERGENPVRRKGAVIHAVNVIRAYRGALASHLGDEIVQQLALAQQGVVQRIEQAGGGWAEARGCLWTQQRHRRHQRMRESVVGPEATGEPPPGRRWRS